MKSAADVIADFLTSGQITSFEAELLVAYFTESRQFKHLAEKFNISHSRTRAFLNDMEQRGILVRARSNAPYQLQDGTIEVRSEKVERKPIIDTPKINQAQRDWMLNNYMQKKYNKKRSQAARLLGVDRYTICEWAMQLDLDQKSAPNPYDWTTNRSKGVK